MPLSLSLPVREEPFSDEECRPFFSGLLPEGGFLNLEVAPRTVRTHAVELSSRVVATLSEARSNLPGRWQDARLIDEIEDLARGSAERLTTAAAEPV